MLLDQLAHRTMRRGARGDGRTDRHTVVPGDLAGDETDTPNVGVAILNSIIAYSFQVSS